MTNYIVEIEVEVHDVSQLAQSALEHATRVEGLSLSEARDSLSDGEEVNVKACLETLLDPGSIAGCDILGSEVQTVMVVEQTNLAHEQWAQSKANFDRPTLPRTQADVVRQAISLREAIGKTLQAVEISEGYRAGSQCLLVFSEGTFATLGVRHGYESGDEEILEVSLDLFGFGDSALVRCGITTAEEIAAMRKQRDDDARARSDACQEVRDRAEFERLQWKFGNLKP